MNPFGQTMAAGDYDSAHTIIVDPGKYDVKIYDVMGRNIMSVGSFPSKMKKVLTFHGQETNGDSVFKVAYDGNKAIMGIGNYSTDTTKSTLHHQMCIYTALGLLAQNGESVNLIVGQPSSDYKNPTELNNYIEKIKGMQNGEIEIEFEGVVKKIRINDLRVYAEGMATYSRLVNGRNAYHIIDLGGKNLNYRFYDANGTLMESFSLDTAGMNHLTDYLKEELRKVVDARTIDLESINFEEAIQTLNIPIIDEIPEVGTVEAFLNFYVNLFIEEQIEKKLANHLDFNKKGHKIIFTGGGTLLLKPYLEARYAQNAESIIFSTRARFDNCSSYLLSYVRELASEGNITPEETRKIFNDYGNQIISERFEEKRPLPSKNRLSEFDMVLNQTAY